MVPTQVGSTMIVTRSTDLGSPQAGLCRWAGLRLNDETWQGDDCYTCQWTLHSGLVHGGKLGHARCRLGGVKYGGFSPVEVSVC